MENKSHCPRFRFAVWQLRKTNWLLLLDLDFLKCWCQSKQRTKGYYCQKNELWLHCKNKNKKPRKQFRTCSQWIVRNISNLKGEKLFNITSKGLVLILYTLMGIFFLEDWKCSFQSVLVMFKMCSEVFVKGLGEGRMTRQNIEDFWGSDTILSMILY